MIHLLIVLVVGYLIYKFVFRNILKTIAIILVIYFALVLMNRIHQRNETTHMKHKTEKLVKETHKEVKSAFTKVSDAIIDYSK